MYNKLIINRPKEKSKSFVKLDMPLDILFRFVYIFGMTVTTINSYYLYRFLTAIHHQGRGSC